MTQYERNRSKGRTRASGNRSRAGGQAARINAVQQARRNTRRNREPDHTKLIILGIALIVLITAVVWGFQSCSKEAQTPEVSEEETQLEKEVTVDGVTITGLSREKAREKILEHFHWNMKVTYGDQEYQVENLMGVKVDALLEEIYTGEPKESYALDVSGLEEAAAAQAAKAAALWDKAAKNGAVSGFDKENGNFIYSPEENGVKIDEEKLTKDILAALQEKNFAKVISAESTVIEPEITQAEAKELYQVIGSFSTTTTANKDRNTNISIASQALDGLIIQPGEEFSFNLTTGNRTLEKGYKPAGAYVNGVLVEEPGGGVCQVSSTLYNAVVFSGLTTTERHAHSYEPSYVTPGEDAMVSYDGYSGPDMKFVNNSSSAVAIRAKFADQKLTISIVGIPILEEGETLSMRSEKVKELDPPEPVYEEDQTLQLDEEVVVKEPVMGSRWVTNLIRKKDGAVVSDEFFHNSTYKGKPATIKRNTSGVVVPKPEEPSSDMSSDLSAAGPGDPTSNTAGSDEIGPGVPTTAATTAAPETSQAPSQGEGTISQTSEAAASPSSPEPAGNEEKPEHEEPGAIAPNPFGEE